MSAGGWPTTLRRQRAPEQIRAFEPCTAAEGLMAIPADCLCTWVPRGGEWQLKFANASCPAGWRHK